MKSSNYIPSLDGIRAISIALVFLSHAGFGHIVPGGFGVTIFFFLSGYLITTLLHREWERFGVVSFRAFYGRRILRLGPPIVVTLLVCFTLLYFGVVEGDANIQTLFSQLFFYYNYFSIYSANVAVPDGLGVLWSLSVEEHFYLIWPAMFLLIARGRIGLRSVIIFLVAILLWRSFRFIVLDASFQAIYASTDTRFDSLLYGCLLALMMSKGIAQRVFPSFERATWLIAIAIGAIIFSLVFRNETFRSTLRYSIQGAALLPLFYYAITSSKALIFRPLNWGPIQRIGVWSYTTYLIHFVVLRGLIFNNFAPDGSLRLVVSAGVLSVGFAVIVHRFVEQPLLPYRRKLTGHRANG